MFCTIRVWYNFVYHTRMVRTYHTRITMQYVQIACHACLNAYSYTVSLSMAPFCLHAHTCRYLFNLYNYTFFLHAAYSYRYSYILVIVTYNIYTLLKINLPFIKFRSTLIRVDISGARMHDIFCASVVASRL